MSKFSSYFGDEFAALEQGSKDIDEILQDKMFLIGGDFYGIQKFIFDNLGSKNAAKVLRAKFAFCELFMIVLAKFICQKFGIDEKCILSCTAGKFEILSPKFDEATFKEIKGVINAYFVKNFLALAALVYLAWNARGRALWSLSDIKS